jgi:hypothetical protein
VSGLLPGFYEFRWDVGHIVFLGAFFAVLLCVGTVLVLAARKARRDLAARRADDIRWHAEFDDLSSGAKSCRHELAGQVRRRTCDHGFDCRTCATHPELAALPGPEPQAEPEPQALQCRIAGLDLPLDRLYDRGHTWVQPQDDGTVLVGLDRFAERLLGEPDDRVLPEPGTRLRLRGPAWHLVRGGIEIAIRSPLDGTVRGPADAKSGATLVVEPQPHPRAFAHLLSGAEVRPWMHHELERLQHLLAGDPVGASLMDGGELAGDLVEALRAVDWAPVWDEMLLQG